MNDIDYEQLSNHAVTLGNMLAKTASRYNEFPVTMNIVLDLILPGYIKIVKDRIHFINSGDES